VKEFLVQQAKGCICPPDFPTCVCGKTPIMKILTRKPVVASEEEASTNPRSKSAKLRLAEKIKN
jgi:16S rRNA (cytosine1402-N4)-methyltransferase